MNDIQVGCDIEGSSWKYVCLIGFLMNLPFCFVKNYHNYSYLNSCLVFLLFLLTFYLILSPFISQKTNSLNIGQGMNSFENFFVDCPLIQIYGIFKFFGTATYAIEYVPYIFVLRNSMKEPEKFRSTMNKTLCVYVLLTVAVGWSANIVKKF